METEKELSSVAKLKMALNKLIELKASNIEDLIAMRTPKILIDIKEWDECLKIIDKMANFEAFDKIVNGLPKDDSEQSENSNSFEERSRKIKEKLNGSSKDSTKKN